MAACPECGYPEMMEADWAIWCPCCGHHAYLEDLALEAAKFMNSRVQ